MKEIKAIGRDDLTHPMHYENDRSIAPLPNVLGTMSPADMKDPAKQKKRRAELLDVSVNTCFGGLPPKPEVFEVRHQCGGTYRITAGTKEKTVSFELYLFKPEGEGKHPVLLTADLCAYYCNDEITKMFTSHGFIVAKFNRCELAHETERAGALYDVYPALTFGMIAAWAWGYHRCVDALLTMGDVDADCICITGHSRGGKATLLAAATDERITFTQASGSGCFGAGCFRYIQQEDPARDCQDHHAETIANMEGYEVGYDIGFWSGPEMKKYAYKEAELPFDLHFFKAAVAPRFLLETNGTDDIWSNPRGSYQSFRAAREMYAAMGIPERIASVYRDGGHGHTREDFETFLKFIEAGTSGRPFYRQNADAIYGDLPKNYDWA